MHYSGAGKNASYSVLHKIFKREWYTVRMCMHGGVLLRGYCLCYSQDVNKRGGRSHNATSDHCSSMLIYWYLHPPDATLLTFHCISLQHREAFTDPDFPPADKSLYINPKTPVTHWKVAQWLRPGYITDQHSCSSVQWAVSRNPGPDDIAQGVLGNCW